MRALATPIASSPAPGNPYGAEFGIDRATVQIESRERVACGGFECHPVDSEA